MIRGMYKSMKREPGGGVITWRETRTLRSALFASPYLFLWRAAGDSSREAC
jgi:hypothetical protein